MPARSNINSRAQTAATNSKGIDDAIGATWIDDSMGAIYTKLQQLNILDDTLILFIMDHGARAKSTLYEAGVRIAFFARYPNNEFFKAGLQYNNLVSNIDIAPTLLNLAGGAQKSTMDGINLISGSEIINKRTTVFVELNKDRGAVTSEFKYIQKNVESYPSGGGKGCGAPSTSGQAKNYPHASDLIQLYDLANDNIEQTNILSTSESVASSMKKQLDCHIKKTSIGSTDYTTDCVVNVSPADVPSTSNNANGMTTTLMIGRSTISIVFVFFFLLF